MKWWLLQKNNCPKCESQIKKSKGTSGPRKGMTIGMKCTNEVCDFKIGIWKFAQIVGDIRQRQVNKGWRLVNLKK